MDSIIVQYNLENLDYNNLEIELVFNSDAKKINAVIVSHVENTVEGAIEFNITLTLLNITIHTFVQLQQYQHPQISHQVPFLIKFIVYNNSNDFVKCNQNSICCMAIEMDILIDSTTPIDFINMPCIQNKLDSGAEKIALIKFMQFCSNFANVLNTQMKNIDLLLSNNHYFDNTFAEVFNYII